jgi:RNA polymerase sigma factor (sigma-70 family)
VEAGAWMGNFERRVEAEIPTLRRYARALLRDSERAEDLLQDCLERALSRRHLFLRPGNLRGWLFRIMRNIHLNNVRATSRRPVVVDLDDVALQGSPADQISHVEVSETLAAFDRLSEEQREVLLLVVVEGLSYREAARVIGLPAGTVMSRMARARERLQKVARAPLETRLRRVK